MGKTRKQRGGQIVAPPFETATPAILGKLSKETGRDFIINVCKKKLPNYLALFRAARGCTDKGCPMKTDADMGWAESEQDFKTQCLRAETLARINPVPANAALDPAYVKTTANWLKAATAQAATAQTTANTTAKAAKAAANAKAAAKATANATAKAAAKATANAAAKAAANAAAKAAAKAAANAAAKAAANAAAKAAANAAAKAAAAKLTETQKYMAKPPTTLPQPPPPATPTTGTAAKAYVNSSLEQKVENVGKKLERASQLLKSMTEPKSVGGYTRRRRN